MLIHINNVMRHPNTRWQGNVS